ncbi:hypothetical protein N0B31_11510 [Salinirubellus salinus]|uniref:CARDB domain-containing protein n=1 Tax=Salinirubellus salinus TaxID=1364945 RepID=A0A9E7QZZ4_9EURY|nr:CARDB domain-containing protein [Salinirubellus salinus]UWM52779.1 hypothetical protein N0B31_11510 [Salinirubellus salinus]
MADDRPIEEEGEIVDLDYDGGTLYPGETETIQRVEYNLGAADRVVSLANAFFQGGESIESVTYSFDDDSIPDKTVSPDRFNAERRETREGLVVVEYPVAELGEPVAVPDGTILTIDVTITDEPTAGPLETEHAVRLGSDVDRVIIGSEKEQVLTDGPTPTETVITEPSYTSDILYVKDGTAEQISESQPSSRDAEFSLVADQPSYYDSMDGYERVTVTPEQPTVGEQVTVEVVVTNIGDGAGTYHARLDNYFTIFGSQDVELEPGEKTTLEFTFSFDKAGTHQLFLTNDRIAEVVVTE